MKKTFANNIFGEFRLPGVLMLIFFLGLSFISGGLLVYTGMARTIKDSIDNQMHLFMFDSPAEEVIVAGDGIKNATNYLRSVKNHNKFSEELVLKGLGIDKKDFFNIVIDDDKTYLLKVISLDEKISAQIFQSTLNNGLTFQWIKVSKNNEKINKNTLIILHGNSSSPEGLLGVEKGIYADPVAYTLAKSNIDVIIPIKYDMYTKEEADSITVRVAVSSNTTFEALEQMKIKGLIEMLRIDGIKPSLHGFSHGAWQALIAAQLNEINNLYYQDFLINPVVVFDQEMAGFYTDYNVSINDLYDYPQSLMRAKTNSISILLGKKSDYSKDVLFINKIRDKITTMINKSVNKKINFIWYDGKHYISDEMVRDFIIKDLKNSK
tara:strand:- start:10 stop:1146 length:1137 start_codon:yes stop_codon:yes gene_type:complete